MNQKKSFIPEGAPVVSDNAMVGLLRPLILELGKEYMADRDVHAKLFVELALTGEHELEEDKLIVECAWAVVAIKKYGIAITDGALMVKQREALKYVFHCYMLEQTKPGNIDAFLNKFPPIDIIPSVDKSKLH